MYAFMYTSKRIIATIFAFAIAISLVMPVAANAVEVTSGANYWQSISADSALLRAVIGAFHSGVCPAANSPDGKHHANTDIPRPNTDNHSFGGYKVKCEYCGEDFMISTSDLAAAYDSYVQDLPATGINSEGYLLWSPTHWSDNTTFSFYDAPYRNSYSVSSGVLSCTEQTLALDHQYSELSFHLGNFQNRWERVCFMPYVELPIDGTYTVMPTQCIAFRANKTDGSIIDANTNYTECNVGTKASGYVYNMGQFYVYPGYEYSVAFIDAVFYYPVFKILPYNGLVDTANNSTYNINTRAGTVCGDLAVMGDNNTLTKVTTTIVNETTNNFYNPGTGETLPIADWTYNYTDRSYDLTLENGENVRVIYGNDNVSVVEGGNTNTYYYYITNNNGGDGGGSGSGGSGSGGSATATGTDLWDGIGDSLGSILLIPLRIIKAVLVKLIGWLTDLADTIGESLAELVDKILGWFDRLPELMGGFLAFLTAIFPFVPDDVMLLFTFGIAAVVFIAIIRTIRRH